MSRRMARAVSAGFGVAMFVAIANSLGGPIAAALAAGVLRRSREAQSGSDGERK